MCRCTTSTKAVTDSGQLLDTFRIQCPPDSHTYAEALLFNLTEQPGVLLGSWSNRPRVADVVFPDTVSRKLKACRWGG